MSTRTRLTRVAGTAAALAVTSALALAAPADAAGATTTHRLGPVRAAAAASATASLPGYVLKIVDVEHPATPLPTTTTWDRNRKREAITSARPSLVADPPALDSLRYVVTPTGLYEQDPAVNGPALRLLGRSARTWVFRPGPSFVGDDDPANHAARLLRDLSPSTAVTTATRTVSPKGVSYTYVDTFDGVKARITVLVRHGRIVWAFVRDAAPPAGIEQAVENQKISFRYGPRHVLLPRPTVPDAALTPARQELGLKSQFRFLAQDARSMADNGEITSVATLRTAVRDRVRVINELDTNDPVVGTADVTDGLTVSVVLPVSHRTLSTTFLWQGGALVVR